MTHRPPFRVLLVAAFLPLAITAIGLGLVVAWLPQLPDPIAVHWGPDGPDQFGPAWTQLALYAALGIGLPVLFGGLMFAGRRAGPSWTQKLLASTSLGVSVLLFVIFVGTTAVQRGLSDAAHATEIGWLAIVGFGAGLVAGAAGWFLMPRAVSVPMSRTPSEPIRLSTDERAVWFARTRVPLPALIALGIGLVLLAGLYTYLLVVSDYKIWPILLLVPIIAAGVLTTTWWRVRVDASGLVVRSAVGWPVLRVRASDLATASVVEISPVQDFGGWGIRLAQNHRWGVITRSGEALQAVRRDGSAVVVTVDDAATGAALLSAYARSS